MPQRLEALTNWLGEALSDGNGGSQKAVDFQLTPASTDASFRRYFRVHVSLAQTPFAHLLSENSRITNSNDELNTLIAMDAPPEKEETAPFVCIANLLVDINLNAPRVLAQSTQQGFLLLSDLGVEPYLDVLNEKSVDGLYADALDALFVMQRDAPRDITVVPAYDEALLLREMALFSEWYCEKQCGVSFTSAQLSDFDAMFQLLSETALAQPQVFVHRDYHSRNLMRTEKNNPGIIDFQDAVIGPVTYDLVSLLRDCYIAWPRERVEKWALDYLHRIADAGIILAESDASYLRWFDWMGVQRHLKAVGIFARLNLRDGKTAYLDDIPRTLNYIRDTTARYSELKPLHELLKVLPQVQSQ